jgi:transaldolase
MPGCGVPIFFVKIPVTKEGLPAVEEAIFAGIPVKVTLLFSREHYLAAAGAFLRGIELRIADGLTPNVSSIVSPTVEFGENGKVVRIVEDQGGSQ